MPDPTDDPTAVLADPTPPPMPPRGSVVDMTTRDYFAAHALAGILAAHAGDGIDFPDAKKAAKWCREYADAMLAELSNTPSPA